MECDLELLFIFQSNFVYISICQIMKNTLQKFIPFPLEGWKNQLLDSQNYSVVSQFDAGHARQILVILLACTYLIELCF